MGFSEMSHAFIVARFYIHLKKTFGEKGIKTFVHATQYYAGQRGRRMAQRALHDGEELTYDTYMRYGEWESSCESIEKGYSNLVVVDSLAPDYVIRITRCPWHIQFKKMELIEAGNVYCSHLDSAICRGFNPYLTYTVEQTLHEHDCCIQKMVDANFKEKPNVVKKKESMRSFEYHCAHVFWSYNEVIGSVLGELGEEVNLTRLSQLWNLK